MANSEVQNYNYEIIVNDDGPQNMTNILDSKDNSISETILKHDEPQSINNGHISNNCVISETILKHDEPQSINNGHISNNCVISETILNADRSPSAANIIDSKDNNTSETVFNDDKPQSIKNILNSNNLVISETICYDGRPSSATNILNSDVCVISKTISNDNRPQSVTNIFNSNENIISENIVHSEELQNLKNVLDSSNKTISKIILNDERPESLTNILNSIDNIIPEIIFNDDRPQIATNNLNTTDNIISNAILNEDRLQTDTRILNIYNNPSTTETSTYDPLNIKAVNTSLSPSETKSFYDTKVNLSVPVSGQTLINGHHEEYIIGDIIWAKIGKYPFWPSIVCFDPESNTYHRKKKKIWFHVRFCNDKGRRSWIKTIENYFGKNELLSKYPNCLTYIKNSEKLMNTWNSAVEEADNLLKLDREVRMLEFMKTFSNSDDLYSVISSASNNYSEDTAATLKVCKYSRKRSLTFPKQNSKMIKTENLSVDGSASSRSVDTPLLSRSDDADSTVSDISMNHVYMEDIGFKTKEKKRKSTKTYPPKSLFTHKYDLSDSMENFPVCNGNNILSDNHDKFGKNPITVNRSVPEHRKFEVSILEGDYEYDNITSINSCRSTKKIEIFKRLKSEKEVSSVNNDQNTKLTVLPQSLSNFKKTIPKKKLHRKETSTGRKSMTTKRESSLEPDTTESEASSKNETYSSVFIASTKNKQLFVKILKRACVVCKSTENTVKCTGSCQSYFHEECLTISEERYRKSVPKSVIKNKKHGRRKRHYSKCSIKKRDSVANLQVINNSNEENIDQLYEKDDVTSKSINDLNLLLKKQCFDRTDKSKSLENPTSDGLSDLSKDKNCIFITNDDTQQLNKLDTLNKEFPEISKEKIINSSMKSVNEKVSKDDSKFICSLCKADKIYCFACGFNIEDHGQKIMCKMPSCGKYYHENCLKDWPQCQWIQGLRNNVRCVVCPHHVCHLCISDNPKSSCKTHFPGEKLCRCIKCPTAYHRSEYCLPAGSQVLTYFDIICSRHFEPPKLQNYHYNAPWCFICTLGGTLICCDLCPSSFHIECLNQNPSEFEEGFTCEECQTGRYPLYGEIVWVKIGQYRWWPAQIIFPNQVPDTVNAITHSVGQFAVRFFGTYDYYWVNRGRVFNFHEGDDENILKKNKMKVIDQVFQDAIVEAAQAHNAYIIDKDKNDAIVAKKSLTKPPKFIRIKFNKPIGNVKNMEFDSTTMTPCECDPTKPNPCGPGSDCINRMLMFECHPQLCPAGDKCNNQRFEKTLYPAMVPFLTKGRGWGLKTLEDIKEGSFIIEYVGDVIDEEEFQRRCLEMHQRNEQNYYFLTIDNSRMIDAGPKGNLSRFMNHSCEPNCVTQKWTVNGDTRIGLFALHDIPSGTELVFDYRLQSCSGVEKKPCHCGAARCSKFIGVKVEEEKKKLISTHDADKCKTKNKRKPLKLKDNVSDSDKSKLSKVLKNDQNISVIENEVYESNIEKMYDSKKSKVKLSVGKQPTILKNENSESSVKLAVKRKWKNSKKNDTNTTKKNVFKKSLSPLPYNYTDKSKVSTLSMSEAKVHVGILKNIEDIKMTRISVNSTNDLMKTEQIHEVLNNAHVNIPNGYTEIQERSRHSLSRLAKSRHSFLSKNNSNKERNELPVVTNKKYNKGKKITTKISETKIKHREILSVKTSLIKNNKMNSRSLQSKTYCKNDSCLICGKGHAELTCKNKKCPRVFHLSCMNKTRIGKSGFICPSHFCSVCKKRKVVAKCKFCVESFCTTHVKGNILKDPLGNGMLCTIHHPNKKPSPIASSLVTTCSSVKNTLSVTNKNESKSINFTGSNLSIELPEHKPLVEEDALNLDEVNEEDYNLTQVVKAECDREYIHIGGFNVCNMSDLVTEHEERYTVPVDTDGDLFKPSSANVVIDIESASEFYQPTDSLEFESIAIESKNSHNYANVHFIPDVSQTKNKWLAAEP